MRWRDWGASPHNLSVLAPAILTSITLSFNTRFAWTGGTFFTVVLLCQFLVLAGNRFWFYILMYLDYNTVVVLCQLLVLVGNSFLCYVSTQCMIQLCGCVSFLVMAGNSSQNENTFLQKKIIGLPFMIRQPMSVFYKTYHSFSLYLSILYISLVPHRSTS